MNKKILFALGAVLLSSGLYAQECYCKLCGTKFNSVRTMMNLRCPNTDRGQGNHELFQGDANSPKFFCVYCGLECNSIRTLVNLTRDCPKHRGHRHEVYEGTLKSRYTCIKCGQTFNNFRSMVNMQCPRQGGETNCHQPCR